MATLDAASLRRPGPGGAHVEVASPPESKLTLAQLLAADLLVPVDGHGVGSVAQVLTAAEDCSGGSADFKARGQHLARSGLKDGDCALEVSPLHSPLLRQGSTNFNIDVRTRDELVKYYEMSDDMVASVPQVHFKWSGQPYIDVVGDLCFKRIVASHVIEHVPDLLAWFNSLHDVLAGGGEVRLFVPDMRFIFDHRRRPTLIHEVIGAHFEHRTRPSFETVVEHMYAATIYGNRKEVPHEYWAQPPRPIATDVEAYDMAALKQVVSDANQRFAGTEYIDGHVWKWTPASFAAQMAALHELGLLKLRLDVLIPTSPTPSPGLHSTEFLRSLSWTSETGIVCGGEMR